MGYAHTDLIDWTSKGPGIASVLPSFELSPCDLAVYRAIARREHDQKRERVLAGEVEEFSPDGLLAWCRASQGRLSFDAGISRSTAARSLKKLAKNGFIEERPGPQSDDPMFRRIVPAALEKMMDEVEPARVRWEAAQAAAAVKKAARWSSLKQPSVAVGEETGDTRDTVRANSAA